MAWYEVLKASDFFSYGGNAMQMLVSLIVMIRFSVFDNTHRRTRLEGARET
jgi:hypothetical protein